MTTVTTNALPLSTQAIQMSTTLRSFKDMGHYAPIKEAADLLDKLASEMQKMEFIQNDR